MSRDGLLIVDRVLLMRVTCGMRLPLFGTFLDSYRFEGECWNDKCAPSPERARAHSPFSIDFYFSSLVARFLPVDVFYCPFMNVLFRTVIPSLYVFNLRTKSEAL